MLVADLDRLEGGRDKRIVPMRDPQEWTEASARGFCDGADPDNETLTVSLLIATGGATVLEAREGGGIVATACYAFENDGIALFAASTLPAHRRQGWQRAMIRERCIRALFWEWRC